MFALFRKIAKLLENEDLWMEVGSWGHTLKFYNLDPLSVGTLEAM